MFHERLTEIGRIRFHRHRREKKGWTVLTPSSTNASLLLRRRLSLIGLHLLTNHFASITNSSPPPPPFLPIFLKLNQHIFFLVLGFLFYLIFFFTFYEPLSISQAFLPSLTPMWLFDLLMIAYFVSIISPSAAFLLPLIRIYWYFTLFVSVEISIFIAHFSSC